MPWDLGPVALALAWVLLPWDLGPVALGPGPLRRKCHPELCCQIWRLLSGGGNGNECGVGAADGERGCGKFLIKFG